MSIRTQHYPNVHGDADGIFYDLNTIPGRKIPFMRGEDICHVLQRLYRFGYQLNANEPFAVNRNRFSNEPSDLRSISNANRIHCRGQLGDILSLLREATGEMWIKNDVSFPIQTMTFEREVSRRYSIKSIFRNELSSLLLTHDEETGLDFPISQHHRTIGYLPVVDDVKEMFSYLSLMTRCVLAGEDHQIKTWYLGDSGNQSNVQVSGVIYNTINGTTTTRNVTGRDIISINNGRTSRYLTTSTLSPSNLVQYYLSEYRNIGSSLPIEYKYGPGVSVFAYCLVSLNYSRNFGSGDTASGQWYILIPGSSYSALSLSEIISKTNAAANSLGVDTSVPTSSSGSVTLQAYIVEWACLCIFN